jgi:hypothetical protein
LEHSAYQIEISSTLPGIINDDVVLFPGKPEGRIAMAIIDKRKGFSFDAPLVSLSGHLRTVRGINYIPAAKRLFLWGLTA